MNKTLAAILIVVVLAVGVYIVASRMGPTRPAAGPAVQIGPVEFALKYRGFDKPDDPLSYRSYWGFGGPQESDDPFVQAVKSRDAECTLVYNGALPKAQWSVVELKDKKPVAFYFDVNADGQLSNNERILPAKPAGSDFGYPYAFLTPDFVIQTEDGREVPFRIMLVGSSYGSDEINYMWSPGGILEGQATLAGKPMKLLLYADGFSGAFTTFGSSSFALVPAGQKVEGYIPRNPLSSLIQHEGTFYRVKLDGTHEKDKTVRAVFERDTTPTGQMTIAFRGKDALKTRLQSANIQGATDGSVNFPVEGSESAFPAGQYRLAAAYVSYGTRKDDEWRMTFDAGPVFEIAAGQTSRIELGEPKLSLGAIEEQDRYRAGVKERTTFAKGTAIYLTPEIVGKNGEIHKRYSQVQTGTGKVTPIAPHLTITDGAGKQIVSADLEYG